MLMIKEITVTATRTFGVRLPGQTMQIMVNPTVTLMAVWANPFPPPSDEVAALQAHAEGLVDAHRQRMLGEVAAADRAAQIEATRRSLEEQLARASRELKELQEGTHYLIEQQREDDEIGF
jgi:hypothetical protein